MRIRQLVWEKMSPMVLMTKEIGFKGHYTIRRSFRDGGVGFALQFCHGYMRTTDDGFIDIFETIDECKVAAQTHFEEWVRATFFR